PPHSPLFPYTTLFRSLELRAMLALVLSILIPPADSVTGRVVDTAGHPIAGAIVEVTELGRTVTTASDGNFRLAIPPGRYTVAVRDRKSTRLNSSHDQI